MTKFVFIFAFGKLALFFQINHEKTPIILNNLQKIGFVLHFLAFFSSYLSSFPLLFDLFFSLFCLFSFDFTQDFNWTRHRKGAG